jgi:hypothetical protein
MKPVLIGINNPVSTAPGHELYPLPVGCTGHRLWRMLAERLPHVTARDYREAFDRRNLVRGLVVTRQVAQHNASLIFAELWGSGRTVVLLGRDVQKAFGHPPLLLHPQVIGGCTWRQLPHPSGRNPWYNDPEHRRLAGVLMEELYVAYRGHDGDAGISRNADTAGAGEDHDQR